MTDMVSPQKRSEIMSRIHQPTNLEKVVHNWLKARHIRHRMYPKVEGNPDIWLVDSDTYVFLDSCFWHGCPEHYREPKSSFSGVDWRAKMQKNRERDARRVSLPYKWVTIWEHDVENNRFKEVISTLSVNTT